DRFFLRDYDNDMANYDDCCVGYDCSDCETLTTTVEPITDTTWSVESFWEMLSSHLTHEQITARNDWFQNYYFRY
ncbi:unnamed protein product, partial [Oikopleura dioica]